MLIRKPEGNLLVVVVEGRMGVGGGGGRMRGNEKTLKCIYVLLSA